jgi:hypothetical protein
MAAVDAVNCYSWAIFMWYNQAMTLIINIPAEAEMRLRRLAEAEGSDLSAYVSKIVQQAAAKPSLDALLEPLRKEFGASGMTDDALAEEINAARDEYRAERGKGPA